MILKIVNVDKTFARTCERLNTFANVYERSQKINVNVQNSNKVKIKHIMNVYFLLLLYYINQNKKDGTKDREVS